MENINKIKLKGYKEKRKEISQDIADKYNYYNAYKMRVDYATVREKYKVEDNVILYESYFGRGLVCGPYALFKYMKNDERFKGFKHVWVLDELEQHELEINEYKDDSSVIFVEFNSEDYFRYLSSAKYLINNVTFQYYFVKKEDQIMINTWHGIPLKHLGFDTPMGNVETANSLRNFLMSDYITSANEFTTKNFLDAYKLDGLYEGNLIETGYPRMDVLFNYNKDEIIAKLKRYGVDIDPNKKLVLYAPTWKGEKYANPTLDVEGYNIFLEEVYSKVDRDKVQVLFKPHQVVYKHLRDKGLLESYYIPATVDTNEILAITDILISDYSSIFFDFLATERPIIFYIPDIETYTNSRGLYYGPEKLPGPITKEAVEIGDIINNIDNYKNIFNYDNYTEMKNWAVKYDDGHVCERVINTVFNFGGDTKVLSGFSNKGKIKLLINNDTMKTNGITTSVYNLLENLDYNKYDITLCGGVSPGENADEAKQNLCSINKNVRVFFRNTTYSGTIEELINNEMTMTYGVKNAKKKKFFPKDLYEREYKRCFPNTTFDYVINFSGYSNFLSLVFAANADAKKLIWMHNDMLAERERFADGEVRFRVLDSIYELYDRMVSCSHSVMEVNIANLSTRKNRHKYSYARNLVTDERINECLKHDLWIKHRDNEYYIKNIFDSVTGKKMIDVIDGIDEGCISFVTMGRLSMEKNHSNLIKAFSKIYEENKNVRLYILGEGPLKKELNALIAKNKLEGKAVLTGNLFNPFGFVSRCDCYIMPSLHEGQPMAILEARMLKMPIVVSNFSTVKDSLYDKGQYLIDTDVDSIYDGMKAFLEGRVPNEHVFNIEEYNKEAIKEFENNLVF